MSSEVANRKGLFRSLLHNKWSYSVGGRVMRYLRLAEARRLSCLFKSCGTNLDIYSPVYINAPESMRVGHRVSVAPFVHIWADGGISIGNRVMIGSHSAITTLTHDYRAERMQETVIRRTIVIEDDVWIGTHSVIMPGVTIGRGAVIGAGSVVTKDVAPMSIIVGVPGELLKMRPTAPLIHPAESFVAGLAAA